MNLGSSVPTQMTSVYMDFRRTIIILVCVGLHCLLTLLSFFIRIDPHLHLGITIDYVYAPVGFYRSSSHSSSVPRKHTGRGQNRQNSYKVSDANSTIFRWNESGGELPRGELCISAFPCCTFSLSYCHLRERIAYFLNAAYFSTKFAL